MENENLPELFYHNKQFKVERCTERDINLHFRLVSKHIEESERTDYLDRMYKSVNSNLAYKLSSNKSALYMNDFKRKSAKGDCFIGIDGIESIIFLYLLFSKVEPNIFRLFINPHSKDQATNFTSFALPESILNYYTNKTPLIIRTDFCIKKYEGIFL